MDEGRKVGIADGMILVAGVAAGLGLLRLTAPGLTPGQVWDAFARPSQGWSPSYAFGLFLELGVYFGIPLLASWTPACLLVQLLKPRPDWRRLRRRPGFVACLFPSLVGSIAGILTAACLWLSIWTPGSLPTDLYFKVVLAIGFLSGSFVLSSWVTMKLCGIRLARPTWIDHLGCLTGVAWACIGMMSFLYGILSIP